MRKFLAVFFCCLITAYAGVALSQEGTKVIKMTVTRVGFEPKELVVERGREVVLKITARDREHGIVIPELGIPSTRLPRGEEVQVRFTADKPGSYRFKCSVLCGWRHVPGWISGTIIVK